MADNFLEETLTTVIGSIELTKGVCKRLFQHWPH